MSRAQPLRLLRPLAVPLALRCKVHCSATPINLERTMNADMHGGQTMAGNTGNGGGRRGSRWRIAGWGAAALILLLPLVAMQFTDEVNWDVADFAFAGALLIGVGVAYELAVRKTGDTEYRAAVGVALA